MLESGNASSFNAGAAPFLQRLKTDTATHHVRLEAQPLLQALMAPGVTVAQYGGYLARMKKIADAYEESVLPVLRSSQPAFAPKRASSLAIAKDLQALAPPNGRPSSLPDFVLPQTVSLPFAWGFAYVMEGAKLGGKVIARHIQKALGFTESHGAAYLTGAGADTVPEWKAFLQALSSYAATARCEEETVNGAVSGFASIHDYFEANGQVYAG